MDKLIKYQVLVNSPFVVLTDEEIQNAIMQYSESKAKCTISDEESGSVKVNCNPFSDEGRDYFYKFDNQWFRFVPFVAPQNISASYVELTRHIISANSFTAASKINQTVIDLSDDIDEAKSVFSLKNIRHYLHVVPFMNAFYYKNTKTFYIDMIVDCNVIYLSKNRTKLVQEAVSDIF